MVDEEGDSAPIRPTTPRLGRIVLESDFVGDI